MSSLPPTPNFTQPLGNTAASISSIVGSVPDAEAGPRVIQSSDNTYIETLSDESEKLDAHFEESYKIINLLIDLYSIENPEEKEAEFAKILESLRDFDYSLPITGSRIFQLDTEFHNLYTKKVQDLQKSNSLTFGQYSQNFKDIYEDDQKREEFRDLDRTMVTIRSIELDDDEGFDIELSKDQLKRQLDVEKRKRAKLSFENEEMFRPEINNLSRQYEKWGITDNELKSFLNNDMELMSKKVQAVKRTEHISL